MVHQGIKCVIFDCEGTLVDSERLCCQALVNTFAQFDVKISMEEALRHFDGGKLSEILLQTCFRRHLAVDIDELEPLYREEARILYEQHLQPMVYAKDVLDELKRRDIEVCVMSNSPRARIEAQLTFTELDSYFKGRIFSAFDANSWKPEPDLVQFAAMSMGFLPSECLCIDDTSKGIQAGVSANVHTVHFKPNAISPQIYFDNVSEINDLRDILKMLEPNSDLSNSDYSKQTSLV
ncbi:HAD-IA family hydrolase [Vibrio gallicus]|uniref:HAD-IA family hydrolase n=1 Tax=Vibrio gallicus TaxID=190897 RepID=UPI0021C409AC|nr:HAD-IA family hydrolase [Vibrio gallicus]